MSVWTVEVSFSLTVEATTYTEAMAAAQQKIALELQPLTDMDYTLDPWEE